ncbi:hypothetical protein HN419_00845 [Candidatus Woesearchaeota archaeon]|jgi:hypothetical protein|nr:hypothetical protein [Candidatus Woesearchaeota archaeon]MBT3537455.1 hypothetical protein [Candidatus Woesearchaeota archaeon]MBT4696947.1 hypothetical protein [Candidatus Woesearchaeota archaeon]MBT4717569.1 hypothetical protein [Candidatus Woesearchaeota archaeon]MBT7106235.1 hypothetical protein [Candidatus Woesearchaeota archaeon]
MRTRSEYGRTARETYRNGIKRGFMLGVVATVGLAILAWHYQDEINTHLVDPAKQILQIADEPKVLDQGSDAVGSFELDDIVTGALSNLGDGIVGAHAALGQRVEQALDSMVGYELKGMEYFEVYDTGRDYVHGTNGKKKDLIKAAQIFEHYVKMFPDIKRTDYHAGRAQYDAARCYFMYSRKHPEGSPERISAMVKAYRSLELVETNHQKWLQGFRNFRAPVTGYKKMIETELGNRRLANLVS